ncbi:inorganic phosphate transporter [Streptomyces subrutilus]|uniref:Phosphate transporter n=1 Tax=Streptomyces subrutilus TaxID=36818 RepID=A0A5P2UD69_9ACTN|nr:inorganic phosphate transporter [Streptomyces subrutilus]QEU77162.1 anion permease [Streptomyces subrutilus]WSJ33871.1 inorganic phosphate transporter [Streptomyces subrutilus]GGZ99100.1 phosphate transporter [Streptomyces subrutilus]
MGSGTLLLVLVIVTALAFDFTNGFHDTANAMATSVATGALTPRVAVTVAGVLNLAGAFLSVKVAETISGGIVDDSKISLEMIFAGLSGAVLWNLLTWYLGLPSSSTYALLGGLIGAVWTGAGRAAVNMGEVNEKVLVPALASPVIACVVAVSATRLAYGITRRAARDTSERGYRVGQVGSASLVALAHGTNDAQKTMGVITLALVSAGVLGAGSGPPWWVVLMAGLAISLGTYAGGWRIIRTMGRKLTAIAPAQGFAAETSAATVILASTHLGFALSTTQVCTGSILGAGLGHGRADVRWKVAGRIAVSWVLTLPAAALLGSLSASAADRGGLGVALVATVTAACATLLAVLARRRPVTPDNVNAPPIEEVRSSVPQHQSP